ncbi:UNVERIFIED_CONTAM: tbc1d7 [Trichonephila clavipes]
MSDKRNFRSSYYDKVGFRGVEEKRSLEILINEKPIDKEKLSKFCLRFTLPAIYREYVWKVLLGVLPVNLENHGSVLDHWSNYYIELEDTLKMMRKIRKEASRPVIHTLMFLMVEDLLEFDTEKQYYVN